MRLLVEPKNRRFQFQKKPSAFHPPAQRNASRRRDARLQSRLFARWNQIAEDTAPTPTSFAEIVSSFRVP